MIKFIRLGIGIISLFSLFFVIRTHIYAHGGEVQYVKINKQYIPENPIVGTITPSKFTVGSESTTSAYLVGKEMLFEIDEEIFPNSSPSVRPIFQWDFSDGGEKAEGSSVSHIYKKPGTYIVKILAKFQGKEDEFKQVNTVQIDVMPEEKYIRPRARIIVNGKEVENSTRDVVTLSPGRNILFDASKSLGNIKTYEWDFGDSNGGKTSRVSHRYPRDEFYPVAVLRVTDDLGISNDTYVSLDMPYVNLNIVTRLFYSVYDFIVGSILKLY